MFLKVLNMKFSRKRSLLLLTIFSASSWSVLTTSASAQSHAARIYSIDGGTVQLKRPNWHNFHSASTETTLNSSDLLRVEAGVDVVLLCPDGDLQGPIRAGDSNVGSTCLSMPRSVRPSFGVSNRWSASDASVPYVISPWAGQVLTATPALRWNATDCEQTYKVTLQRRAGENWVDMWSLVSERSSMAYPADQPVLEPGEEYVLRVAVINGSAETDLPAATPETPEDAAVFSLVSGEETQAVVEAIASVNALDIDAAIKTLILVEDVYPQYKLFAQGINELSALIESGTERANIYRLLGDYYIRTGLALPAQESYTQAIALAKTSENLEEEALAGWGLGTVYGRVGDQAQARTYLEAAEAIANTLGDPDLIAGIGAELSRLQSSGE